MPGPQFTEYFGPVLRALDALGGSGRPAEVADKVAELTGVSPDEQSVALRSGGSRYANRVAWSRFYLAKAGLIDSSTRGVWRLSDAGRAQLGMTPNDAIVLFRQIHASFPRGQTTDADDESEVAPPPELGDPNVSLVSGGRKGLLERLGNLSPAGFERFCQRTLRESGFQNVRITGQSGDEGVDGVGVFEVSPLLSFKVVFQCKRYAGSVTPSQVRDFRGAMSGRAEKGLIITTGTFTADARKEAVRDGVPPIELVDGEKLVSMCEALELGVKAVKSYVVDEDFFREFA